jgi:thiaminase
MVMGFSAQQLERHATLWRIMLTHPFLIATRDGTIAHETFARWMRQDYLFVEAAIRSRRARPEGAARHCGRWPQ